jgi:hypothetical protein
MAGQEATTEIKVSLEFQPITGKNKRIYEGKMQIISPSKSCFVVSTPRINNTQSGNMTGEKYQNGFSPTALNAGPGQERKILKKFTRINFVLRDRLYFNIDYLTVPKLQTSFPKFALQPSFF